MADATSDSTSKNDEYRALGLAALLYTRAAGLAADCLKKEEEADLGEIFKRALHELNCNREELVSLWSVLLAGSQAASRGARRLPMNREPALLRIPAIPERASPEEHEMPAFETFTNDQLKAMD